MPQIVIIIIILIIRLAAEGFKENSKYSTGSFRKTYKEDIMYRKETSASSHAYDERPTLDQAISRQKQGAYVTKEKPVPSYQTSEIESDGFDNYDTDDYESYTKAECYEEDGHFVEEQVQTYSSYDMRSNKIKFMIYVLVYCMWEDDNEITKKEKRMFKTISRAVSMNLNEKDTQEVKSFIDTRIDLDDVVNKQQHYQLDLMDVINTLSSLRKQLKREPQYNRILEIVENRFQFEL